MEICEARWAHGVVVSHTLRMRMALGSNPSVSTFGVSCDSLPHAPCARAPRTQQHQPVDRSAVVWWLVFPPVTRKTRVQFPAAEFSLRPGCFACNFLRKHCFASGALCWKQPSAAHATLCWEHCKAAAAGEVPFHQRSGAVVSVLGS